MFKKPAAAYGIHVDEMKRMRDVLSSQETRPYIPSHISKLTPRDVTHFSRHFAAV